jgi:hypothetical protein
MSTIAVTKKIPSVKPPGFSAYDSGGSGCRSVSVPLPVSSSARLDELHEELPAEENRMLTNRNIIPNSMRNQHSDAHNKMNNVGSTPNRPTSLNLWQVTEAAIGRNIAAEHAEDAEGEYVTGYQRGEAETPKVERKTLEKSL